MTKLAHLQQAFAASRKLVAMQGPDPEKALAKIESSGLPAAPPTFYKQPMYYKANRFAVIGTDDDVVWPAYSKFLDFELELGLPVADELQRIYNPPSHIDNSAHFRADRCYYNHSHRSGAG
jgi:hypothetical protein